MWSGGVVNVRVLFLIYQRNIFQKVLIVGELGRGSTF